MKKIAIVGVGYTLPRPTTPELSYKELEYEAAQKAYDDAGLRPENVGSFVSCLEDLNEGTSIADEYTPDQVGAVLKPMCTVGGDGLHGIADAVLRLRAGLHDCVMVVSHSKASNIVNVPRLLEYALDPVFNRPLNMNPHAIAGMEMSAFLNASGNTEEQCAAVVAKNKRNALRSEFGAHASTVTAEDVLHSPPAFTPLKELDVAPTSDAAFCVLLATEDVKVHSDRVWLDGVGFCNDTPTLESRDWSDAVYARLAAKMALKQAGLKPKDIDLFEVDDQYSYKELQHLEAIGVFERAGKETVRGTTAREGDLPVNASGGALGAGFMLDASGLFRIVELALQLRRQAGRHQVPKKLHRAMALTWRGVPTTSGAAVVLSR